MEVKQLWMLLDDNELVLKINAPILSLFGQKYLTNECKVIWSVQQTH